MKKPHNPLPSVMLAGSSLGSYGRSIVYKDRAEMGNGKGPSQRRNAHIPRQALRASLIGALRGDVIRWGRQLDRFDEDETGVTLHFQGARARDGVHLRSARRLVCRFDVITSDVSLVKKRHL